MFDMYISHDMKTVPAAQHEVWEVPADPYAAGVIRNRDEELTNAQIRQRKRSARSRSTDE
jgi:hypothetical protein